MLQSGDTVFVRLACQFATDQEVIKKLIAEVEALKQKLAAAEAKAAKPEAAKE